MKKFIQITCVAFGSEVLADGPIFYSLVILQERGSFACKQK